MNDVAQESTMLAMVLTAPEGRGAIECRTVPRPVPEPGEALIKVHATSVMSADLPTLDGVSAPGPGLPGPTFPMIMGNEFVGEVADCPGGELRIGQRVAVGFGGYGFTRNGGACGVRSGPGPRCVAFHLQPPRHRACRAAQGVRQRGDDQGGFGLAEGRIDSHPWWQHRDRAGCSSSGEG
ncbi:alcohol dehydrogenase catalytic domain-containing protein [Arthrobacter woluwensis]|nr:alcohol dehydrogenase catalytic domain-containing protein [Arthrobacter woluwensis]